jgi:tRNA(Ile)-lysidine synthase
VDVVEVRETVRAGGLLGSARPVVAMLSGGRDSVCLLDIAVALCSAGAVRALHVNYGLRAAALEEERYCVALCEQLGVALEIVRAELGAGGEGNVQSWARDVRYAATRAQAARDDALIATGHTASDQVETILYRLAASPGRRALLGMPAAEGPLVRPLLGLTREQTAAYCEARGLSWCEDESNADSRYARVRVRERLVAALRTVHPAAESNVLRTARLLREETELFDALVAQELSGGASRGASITLARLRELPTALARLVVIRLAEDAAGTYVPQAGERVDELLALGERGGRAELHVGGQAGAVVHDGALSMRRLAPREARKQPPGKD